MNRVFIVLIFLCVWNSLFAQSTVTLTIENANCTSPTGTVTINSVTTSASPNYTIAEASTTLATNVTLPYSITNVSVGTHTYVITGSNSVAVTFTADVISNTTIPTVTASANGTVTCFNPLVLMTATSNVSSATYSWAPQNVATNTAVTAGGTATIFVTDPSNNCTTSTVISVPQNTAVPTISATTNGSITCTQTLVVVTGTSSTAGVTYSWNPSGATTNTISTTSVGIHTLIITDPSNGCKSVKSITVYPITAFIASTSAVFHVKCNGAATGSVEVDVTGGSGIYSLTIVNTSVSIGSFNSFTIPVTNLSAGTYTFFMLDTLSGCTNITNVTITEPAPIVLTTTVVSQFTVCEGDPVKILSSISGGVAPYQYAWLPLGGNTATLDIVAGPNSYTLQAVDANSCVVYSVKTITVYPKPVNTLLTAPVVLCGSVCVTFSLAVPQNTIFGYNWLFTDKNGAVAPIQVTQYTPTICFTSPGIYDVDFSVFSQFGCSTQYLYPAYIQEYPIVKADYSYVQPEGALIFNDVLFTNNSTGAMNYSWYVENDLVSVKAQPSYIFYEPGNYLVALIASNPACADTALRKITVGEATFMHFPNAFTPNNDKINDEWKPVFYGDFQGGDYELAVFDRWGKRIFWTVIISKGWDGTFKDKPCEEGIYSWEMKITSGGINAKRKGMITLYR
jgi:gliding motility-associated-like protein